MKELIMNRYLVGLIVVLLSPLSLMAQHEELAKRLENVFDETTIAYAHLDLKKIDFKKVYGKLQEMGEIPNLFSFPPAEAVDQVEGLRQMMVKSGASRIVCTASLYDLESAPVVAIVVEENGKLDAIQEMLNGFGSAGFVVQSFAKERLVVLARDNVMQRLKNKELSPRSDVAKVLNQTMTGVLSVHLIPSSDQLRVIRELLPRLGEPLEFVTGKMIADGIQSASVTLHSVEPLKMNAEVQSASEESAMVIKKALTKIQQKIRPSDPERLVLKGFMTKIKLKPERDGLILDIGKEEEDLWKALQTFFESARKQAVRGQLVNDLKQIMLAFHNFHDANRYFPDLGRPQDKGKPGLSWRVHILPYLDQAELYEQFKLDEPWDSPHNVKLVSKIPAIYKPRDQSIALGKTLLVIPRGKGFFANPYFDANDKEKQRAYGRRMREFLDGTSNTISILPVVKAHAVTWTKPDDFLPDSETVLSFLKDDTTKRFTFATTDGAVHRISFDSLTAKEIMAMMTIAGGEIIDWNK